MKDATIERLSRIIADPISGDGGSNNNRRIPRRPNLHIRIGLAEGMVFALFARGSCIQYDLVRRSC